MASFSEIAIVYNPNSTGDAPSAARELKRELRKRLPGQKIELHATKYAGHAEEIAKRVAAKAKRPLIVSSSGDGGYNEVVNGVMQAGKARAVCAVLPAGNANDHSRTLQDQPLGELIAKGKTSRIDLIRVSIQQGDKPVRYAHSYVGLGLTPVVAVELNKTSLNALKELWLAIKVFKQYRPFTIERGGKRLELDSLLFANINQMAKVLTLAKSPQAQVDDGLFEVITFPKNKKRKLLKRLAKAATVGLDTRRQESSYEFKTHKSMPMQLDGEVIKLPAKSTVLVESVQKALETLI